MSKKKRKRQKSKLVQHLALIVRPFQGAGRPVLIATGMAFLLIASAVFAWKKWGGEIQSNPRFRLSAENLQLTEQPSWIWTDVKTDVLREHSLEDRSILDKQLLPQVADAFAVHPWIAEVKRVRKTAAGIVVDVRYRRPAAMVEITIDGKTHLVLVDPGGTVLPTDHHLESQINDFLRISLANLNPYGAAGSPWGDSRVAEAAGIADAWGKEWRELQLYRIIASTERADDFGRGPTTYELQTRSGKRVIWGRPPGKEVSGESAAADKIRGLVSFVKQHGPLDEGPAVLDARFNDIQPVSTARLTPGAPR